MLSLDRFDKIKSYDLALNGTLFAATAIVLTVFYFIAIRPLDHQLSDQRHHLDRLKRTILRTSDISQKRQQLEAELSVAEQTTTKLLQRIPTSPRESDFLAQVCHLSNEVGMEVADYHPGVVDRRENHHEMEVRLSMRGTYESLCKFLEQVDGVPRLCRLIQLDVSHGTNTERLAVEMSFRIYFAPNSEPEAKRNS